MRDEFEQNVQLGILEKQKKWRDNDPQITFFFGVGVARNLGPNWYMNVK